MTQYQQNHNIDLDWDTAIPDAPPIVIIPPGTYYFRVVAAKRSEWALTVNKIGGCKYMDLTLQIQDQAGEILGEVNDKLTLHPIMLWKIRQFWTSVGEQVVDGQPFVPPWGRITGAGGWCKIKTRTYTNKHGEEREANDVEEYLAPASPAVSQANDVPF